MAIDLRWTKTWRLVALVFVIQVFFTTMAGHNDEQTGREPLDAIGYALLAGGPLLLLLRRRFPVATLAGVMATTATYYALAYPYGPAFVALVVAIVTAVTVGRQMEAAIICGTGYVGYLVFGTIVDRDPPGLVQAGALGAWLLVMLIGSEVLRIRRERHEDQVRSRAEAARRKQGEERLRIARELHDVLAHNISLINVQAGVALHLLDEQPEQARTALAAIKDASKEALGELRSVLGVLRGDGDTETETAPRAPAPTLDRIDELVDRTVAAGLPVRLSVQGSARPLPPSVDLAAYRIVQEALTNVTRHAGLASATVTVAYGDDELIVTVEDDGYGAPVTTPADHVGTGSGISGMRHRATSLGGTLEAGPRLRGGFRVVATLPLTSEDAE